MTYKPLLYNVTTDIKTGEAQNPQISDNVMNFLGESAYYISDSYC